MQSYKVHLPPNSCVWFNGIRYVTYGDYWATGKDRYDAMRKLRVRIARAEFFCPNVNRWRDIVFDDRPEEIDNGMPV